MWYKNFHFIYNLFTDILKKYEVLLWEILKQKISQTEFSFLVLCIRILEVYE